MNILSKDSISSSDYEWFKSKLDSSFHIEDDGHSKVIFGFNGIGKSTIFKCIKQLNNRDVDFLEYGEIRDQIVKGKDKLLISLNINQIEQLKSRKVPLLKELNIKKLIKDTYGYSTIRAVTQFGEKVENVVRDNSFNGFTKTQADIQFIESGLSGVSSGVFINAIPEISEVISAEQELQNEKDRALFSVLSSLNEFTDENETVCPVCNSNVANLKHVIQEKMKALSDRKSNLIIKLSTSNIRVDESTINDLVATLNRLNADPDLKADYILCGGSSSKLNSLQSSFTEAQNIKTQLQSLESEAEASYNNLLRYKSSLEKDLRRYFEVDSDHVIYDDSEYTITITFPRELKTYSTGEINLISFLFRMYSFIGSDKHLLILDDPVSSLDLVNHYKIAYEIVKNNRDNKKLLILTHSVEFVNVVNSQHPNNFKFFYLEEISNQIFLQPIVYNQSDPNPNIISLHRLQDISPFNGFIEALRSRENEPDNPPLQRLFHFSIEKQHLNDDSRQFSNHDFIDLIDSFTEFGSSDFFTNSLVKILHLVALRIWLESKLFALIPETEHELQEVFLQKDTIHKKIDFLFPRLQLPRITVSDNINRDVLMSKKVMLNQNIHYYSQIMPFAYAINISLDDLRNEIMQLRELFADQNGSTNQKALDAH